MLVVQEPLSPCEVSLEIEVETSKVAEAVDKVYREYSEHITVPGFRKGKAPLSFVKQRVPNDKLRERATEILVEPAYQEAVKQEALSPFGHPKLELVNLETTPPQSFKFKAVVPLAPKVEPAPYTGVEIDRVTQEITDEIVESRISQIQERAAEFPVVERPAQVGDVVAVEISITPEGGETVPARNTVIRLGDPENIPGLTDELVGVSPKDCKIFTLTYPADYPNVEIAGTSAEFHVEVFEVHDRIVPDLDDEFAKKFGKAETFEEFKNALRADLEKTAAENAKAAFETALVDKIVAASKIDYPSLLLDQEVNDEIQNLLEDLKKQQIKVEDYLTRIGQTAEQLTNTISTRSDQRIRRGLLLGNIAKTENLQLTDEDIEKEIAERAAEAGTTPETMRAYLDSQNQFDMLRNTAQTKKVLAFLTSSAIITDKAPGTLVPDSTVSKVDEVALETPTAEAAAKPKTRKKKEAVAAVAEDPSE